jgi:uncharacterized membrane protein YdbT with pleckstrin-like domain
VIRLDPDEQLLIYARRHPAPALDGPASLFLLVAAGAIALALLVDGAVAIAALVVAVAAVPLAIAWLRWRNDVVFVTDRRLLHRWGIISRSSSETAIERIGDVRIEQGLLGRLLDYGDLEVVAGSDLGADRLRQLRYPERVSEAIRAARDA